MNQRLQTEFGQGRLRTGFCQLQQLAHLVQERAFASLALEQEQAGHQQAASRQPQARLPAPIRLPLQDGQRGVAQPVSDGGIRIALLGQHQLFAERQHALQPGNSRHARHEPFEGQQGRQGVEGQGAGEQVQSRLRQRLRPPGQPGSQAVVPDLHQGFAGGGTGHTTGRMQRWAGQAAALQPVQQWVGDADQQPPGGLA